MRDSKQSKVYAAERHWEKLSKEDGLPDPNRIVTYNEAREVIADISNHLGVSVPSLRWNAKPWQNRVGYYSGGTIYIPRPHADTATISTILHELAHHVDRSGWELRSHGGGFTESMITVVEAAFGTESAERLRGSYRRSSLAIGVEEERAHVQKAASRRATKRPEYGDTVEGWVLRTTRSYEQKEHPDYTPYEQNDTFDYINGSDEQSSRFDVQVFKTLKGAVNRLNRSRWLSTEIERSEWAHKVVYEWTDIVPVTAEWRYTRWRIVEEGTPLTAAEIEGGSK